MPRTENAKVDDQAESAEIPTEKDGPTAKATVGPKPNDDEVQPEKAKPTGVAPEEHQPSQGTFSIPAKFAAIGIVLLFPVVIALMASALHMQTGGLDDIDCGDLWSRLPFVDNEDEDKDYRRWNPWIDCASNSMKAIDQQKVISSGRATGAHDDVTVSSDGHAGDEQPGATEDDINQDIVIPSGIPNC